MYGQGVSLSMLKNVFLLTLAGFAMRGVGMLFQVFLSEQVGAAGLGLLQLILTVNAFAVTIGTSGIRTASMYLTAEEYGHRRPSGIRSAMFWCMGAGLALSTIVGLGMMLGAQALAAHWVKDLRAIPALRLLGLTLPLNCLNCILCGYFTACGQLKTLVPVEIADRVASVGLTVLLLRRGIAGDVSHACVSIIGGSALACLGSTCVLLAVMLCRFAPYGPSRERTEMGRRLFRFCVPVALNDYLRSGLGTLEQFLIPYGLSKCGGSRTQALADYGTIHGMVFPVLLFLNIVLFNLADLLIPRLAKYRACRNDAAIQRLCGRALNASRTFSCVVGGLLFLLADALGLLFYDSVAAGRYLRLFAPLLPILYLDCIVDGMHKGLGEQIYCVRVNTLTNFLDVLGLFFLLPRWGIFGYFFTYTVTHVLNFFLSLRRLIKVTGLKFDLRKECSVLLCIGLTVLFLFRYGRPLPRWPHVFMCGGIYLAMVFLSLVLTKKKDA